MVPEPAENKATYEDLHGLPENVTGEIIDGRLIVTPRPSVGHSNAAVSLVGELAAPYRFGRGGPGGWVILIAQEVMLGEDLLVPDLSGWRKERFPGLPQENWISIAPDWVCEILSPGTARNDKIRKMPIFAQYGVRHVWLIDPIERTLEVFRLESGRWIVAGLYAENDRVAAEPFQEVEMELANFWLS